MDNIEDISNTRLKTWSIDSKRFLHFKWPWRINCASNKRYICLIIIKELLRLRKNYFLLVYVGQIYFCFNFTNMFIHLFCNGNVQVDRITLYWLSFRFFQLIFFLILLCKTQETWRRWFDQWVLASGV